MEYNVGYFIPGEGGGGRGREREGGCDLVWQGRRDAWPTQTPGTSDDHRHPCQTDAWWGAEKLTHTELFTTDHIWKSCP